MQDFVKPTLLVGLLKPPEELSMLLVMKLLYYYVMAHQDSFNIFWIKRGAVVISLVFTFSNRPQEEHGLEVLGGCWMG